MADRNVEDVINKWGYLKEQALKDLTYLMKEQGISKLVYRGYTPTFNDGDPCEPCIRFLGKPNCVYGDDFVYVDAEDNIRTLDCYNSFDTSDLIVANLEPEIINAVKEWQSSYFELSIIQDIYPIPGFRDFLYNISGIIFETNQTVLVKLIDGELKLLMEEYSCY